jgi:uncharacterized membrane protein YdjX (TVP38/TMEM64 family)
MNARDFWRWLAAVGLVLLVPLVPFIGLGEGFETRVESWLEAWFGSSADPLLLSGLVVAVLASDVLLPVPSSFVNTLAGAQLGFFMGTLVAWLGMSLGAVFGFALARWLGHTVAVRLSNADDLARMQHFAARRGPAIIVLTRALPVLAEAAVLLLGSTGLAWRRFLPPLLLANLGLAAIYAGLGRFAHQQAQLPVALAASVALPVLAAMIARLWLPQNDHSIHLPETSALEPRR